MSLIKLLLEQHDSEARRHAYRIVAELVKARLEPDDAAIVAGWFDRLGAGEDPKAVFKKSAGKPRGKTKERKALPDGRIPDDYDIAWIVKQNIDRGIKPAEVKKAVAKALGMGVRTVGNIYSGLKPEIDNL